MNAMRTWVCLLALASSFTAGCHQPPPTKEQGPQPDPEVIAQKASQAKLVASGKNTELTYKAPEAGQIYVIDAANGQLVYDAPIAAGEKFYFAPASSRATIDKQAVALIRGTNQNDEYHVYFLPQ